MTNLSDMSVVLQGLAGEEVNGGELPLKAPPRAVGGVDHVLVIVGNELGAGVGRAAQEVGIMHLKELLRHRARRRHHHVRHAEAEVQQRAVLPGHGGHGLVRPRA